MKRVVKKTVCSALILALLISLTGCFDSRELNTLGYVMGVAIDKGDKEGETELTLQLAKVGNNAQSSASGSKSKDSGGDSYVNVTGTGKDINKIIRDIEYKISRRIYMAHNQMIILGEEHAKNGVRNSMDFFARAPEARMMVHVMVAKGNALDILEAEPIFEKIPATELKRMIEDQVITSTVPSVMLFDFINDMLSRSKSPVAPLVEIVEEKDGKKARFLGSAVFKDYKMIGQLNHSETRGMLYINNEVETGIMPVEIGDSRAAVEIMKSKTKVTVECKEDGNIQYNIVVESTVGIGDQYGSDNLASDDNMPLLLEEVEKTTKREIQMAFEKAKELGTDIFGFGKLLYRKHPRNWEKIKNQWDKEFRNVQVNIKVKVNPGSNGRIMQPIVPLGE